MTSTSSVSGANRRLLERLERVDSASAAELAVTFDLTPAAVRQHLEELARAGLVDVATTPSDGERGRGRPAQRWRLMPAAAAQFPDHHADLTVSLLGVIRETLGESGLDKVIEARTQAQLAGYRDERTQHVLSGDQRCSYRVLPAPPTTPAPPRRLVLVAATPATLDLSGLLYRHPTW